MIKTVCKSGLQTLALPSYNNKPQEYVNIIVYVATCLDFKDDEDFDYLNLCYSPSHLIEHTVAVQNDNLFTSLRKEGKCEFVNAVTNLDKTYYIFKVSSEHLKTTLPTILNSIYKIKLDDKIYRAEQDVINHEYYNEQLTNISDDDLIKNSKEFEDAKAKVEDKDELEQQELFDKIKKDLMFQNLSQGFLQNYYNKNYLPENSIVAITNCDKKTYDDFQNVTNNFFDATNNKEPIIHDLKAYQDYLNGEYTNDVIDELFQSKYTIFEFKDRLTDRSKYTFFFKFPNEKNKYSAVAELYQYIFSNPDKVSFNEKDMINILRRKRHLVYAPSSIIDNLYSKDKNTFSLSINSSCINTHKVMTGIRALINKIGFSNYISPNDFKYAKKKFKEYYITSKYYGNNAMTILNDNILSIFAGNKKHCNIIEDTKIIDAIRYEDFINFAKYVAKTENYSIIAYGNFIKPSDLKAFELKNKLTYNDRDSSRFTGEKNVCSTERCTFIIAKNLQPEIKKDDKIEGNEKPETVQENTETSKENEMNQ